MIPPSVALIIYGIIAEENIPRLFLDGIHAGLMEGGFYSRLDRYYCRKKGFGGAAPGLPGPDLTATWKAIPAFFPSLHHSWEGFTPDLSRHRSSRPGWGGLHLISLFIYGSEPPGIISISAESMKGAGMIMSSSPRHCLLQLDDRSRLPPRW